jgi:hypothetical protein
MGINALKAKSDQELLQSLREQGSEENMWPLGSICCGLAHYQIFQDGIKSNQPVTKFEDDAILVPYFDSKSKFLME